MMKSNLYENLHILYKYRTNQFNNNKEKEEKKFIKSANIRKV